MSPEIVWGKEYSGFSSDVWWLGVVLYVLLCGRFPFKANTEHELYHKIRRGSFQLPDSFVSNTGKRVIKGILRVDQSSRPQIGQILNHEWVVQPANHNLMTQKWSHHSASGEQFRRESSKSSSSSGAVVPGTLVRPVTTGGHGHAGIDATDKSSNGTALTATQSSNSNSWGTSRNYTSNFQIDDYSAFDTVDTPRFYMHGKSSSSSSLNQVGGGTRGGSASSDAQKQKKMQEEDRLAGIVDDDTEDDPLDAGGLDDGLWKQNVYIPDDDEDGDEYSAIDNIIAKGVHHRHTIGGINSQSHGQLIIK